MKAVSVKATLVIQTDLDAELSSFQSKDAKHVLELIEMAVQENRTEITERELNNGVIMITITDADAADSVVKSLEESDLQAKVVDRKAWLREQLKKRTDEKGAK